MKPSHLLLSLLLTSTAFAQDRYQQFLSNKIVATKIPALKAPEKKKRLHRLTYDELKNFDLVRVRAPIGGIKNYDTLTYGGLSNVPELKFATGKGNPHFKVGDWLRILSISQTDVAELEAQGRKIEIANFANGNLVYSMIALKMSPDFKRSEFFILNVLAAPSDEIAELEVFKRDLLSTAHQAHIKEIQAGDLLVNASEMKFGKQGRLLGANSPLVVESVSYEKQPWRLVWKYTLNLRIVNCPPEFRAVNCRGTYEEEYLRKPMVFLGKIPLRQ